MRFVLSVAVAMGVVANTAMADEATQQKQCLLQAEVMGAVQEVRLERVRKANAVEEVQGRNPHWPETLDAALPAIVEFVYGMKRRELKKVDLAGDTMTTCMQNFDEIKALGDSIKK